MTGLTTAYYLTKFVPEAKITLYEASGRLGGWIDTEKVEVRTADGEKGTVLFERGARSVLAQHSQYKWDDLVLYELVS
jgi:oxygen-dependent protoporphyrinogen oxidase